MLEMHLMLAATRSPETPSSPQVQREVLAACEAGAAVPGVIGVRCFAAHFRSWLLHQNRSWPAPSATYGRDLRRFIGQTGSTSHVYE